MKLSEISTCTYLCNLLQRMPLDELHNDTVAIEVMRLRYREPAVVQGFHVGKLFRGRNSRQVDPK